MRKLFSLFAALTLSVGLWAETVSYLYPVYKTDGVATSGIKEWQSTTVDATEITNSSATLAAGWYVVKGTNVTTNTLVCNGAVNIILADNAKLTATGGINVTGTNSLTIYAQSTGTQMGKLIADATDVDHAAGIGGGSFDNGSNITINGGTVTANGGDSGAGIGGGVDGSGSNITINGGIITANGGSAAAGIGGGNGGYGSNITINGGIITAVGLSGGAGIGGGMMGSGSNITILAGTVTATGGGSVAGIGGGIMGSGTNIFVATSLVVKADGNNPPTTEITNTGGDLASSLAGKRYATIEPVLPVSTSYLDENGETQNIDAFEVKDASEAVTWGTAGQTTWFVVNGTSVQLSKGAVCAGDVRLILADGAKLTAKGASDKAGIEVSGEGNSLTIYGYTNQSGQLIATGGGSAAGIGGGYEQSGSNITINGGKVAATGGETGAGIGGGDNGSGSYITINGGSIAATGGEYGSGIGGGRFGSGSNITINGGEVTATGGYDGAGIGGGNGGSGSNITINGGIIEATGGDFAAGIGGGGMNGSGSYITINGGIVTATSGDWAAGIGGGMTGNGSYIYISDAYVLKAGAAANPTDIIAHSSATDLASTLTQRYVKMEGLATPYTRIVTANSWGTVCLPYAATDFSGVTFYKVNYYNASENALYLEEVSALEAGKPYIFEATEDGTLTINHSATAPMAYSEAGNEGGLYGSFARTTLAYDADHAYAAISGGAVNVVESGYTVTVPACRAYLDMDEVATSVQPHKAPLRAMGVPRGQATNLETIDNAQCAIHNGKFLRNGQFIIVREGKMFNAQGMEVK